MVMVYDDIKIFYFGDGPIDWVAASNLEEARQCLLDTCGMDPQEVDLDEIGNGEVSKEDLRKLTLIDPDTDFKEKFWDGLERMKHNGTKFPTIFASTEY